MNYNQMYIQNLLSELSYIEPRYKFNKNEPDTWSIVKDDIRHMLNKYIPFADEIDIEVIGDGEILKTTLIPLSDRATRFLEQLQQS